MSTRQMQQLRGFRLFTTRNAIWLSLVGSFLLTGIMLLTHINREWVVDSNFHTGFAFCTNVVIIFIVLFFNFSIIRSHIRIVWKYIIGIVGSLALTVVFSLLSGLLHQAIYNNSRFSDPGSINLTRDAVVAIFANIVSLILYNFARRQQFRIEKEQMQTENLMVRYEALENQLDPHFLFNSLNTLSGLIGNENEKAQTYLQQLASTYRYIMQNRRLVYLDEELQFVRSYCNMIMTRYGDNITFERHIDKELMHHMIIPISIQLLIENALKHNVVSNRHPLTVTLSTTDHNTFCVSNVTQPKQETTSGNGVGLANLGKRYKLLCDKDITISNQGNIFAVEIPILTPAEAEAVINKLNINNDKHENSNH